MSMPEGLECDKCGEKDFYEENCVFFCNECGTQAQATKDLPGAIIAENTFSSFQKIKIIKKPKVKKVEAENFNQLTSWECYNYILVGLVDELIKLGASANLKKTVHTLWMKYLVKLEVLRVDAAPKLGLSTWKKDAKILFGYEEKKVRKSRSKYLYENVDNLTREGMWHLKKKQKKSAIMENYKNCTLLDKSDGSILEFEPENVLNSTTKLEYNSSITSEMKGRLKRKRNDDDNDDINVSNISTSSFSRSFLHSADNLSRNKVFAIIYLSLLINNEDIQLGDMLRFIREGHLSYENVEHFLPKNAQKDDINIKSWNKNHMYLNNYYHRDVTCKIAKYLEVCQFIPCQNLVKLCKRYCKEMNLPADVCDFTINLMARLPPNMTSIDMMIPNYEGRVMSLIMFTLKFMFGLDDRTENHLSTYAEMLNERQDVKPKMFVWQDWIHYIHYRKLVITQHHFPTQYVFDNEGLDNVNLCINFLENSILKPDEDFEPKSSEDAFLKEILDQLNEEENEEYLNFSASLIPFRDYVKVLMLSKIPNRKGYLQEVLNSKFDETSLKFLTHCDGYLAKLKEDTHVSIKERGAYEDVSFASVVNRKTVVERCRKMATQEIPVKIIKGEGDEVPTQAKNEDGSYVVFNYAFEDKLSDSSFTKKDKYTHYKPYKTYWSTSILTITEISKKDARTFIRTLPDSFQSLLNECARIIEQEPHILLEEFMIVEAFLCRVRNFEDLNVSKNADRGEIPKTMIMKGMKNW